MSRIAYLECASGAAGDMLLAAIIDLGLPIDVLRGELAKLPLDGYRIETAETRRCGLRALKLDVVVDEPPKGARHLSSILELIRSSELADAHKARAIRLFERLGEAEASVHGTSVEKVHFHEVGAVDSIVDIVGAVIAISWLGVERVSASPLNVGTGTVTTEHGQMPVPAPATARLLYGVPCYGAGEGERLTPTGALLVTDYASSYGPLPPMRPTAIGCGAGTLEDPERPNILRIFVGEEHQ
jgi:uncharacterized protein (TIGR00299 family) protein